MIVALLFCAVALAAVAKEPAPAPRNGGKYDPNRWAHLPGGGGDYSLGANYGPLFKGKVGGAAQDVDNDNNNNDNNDNNNNVVDNAPATVMGDMNEIDIFDEITNVNLNFDSNPDLNSNGNVFESSNTKVEQLPTPQFWTPEQITALVTSVVKNMPGATEKNVHVKVNGHPVDTAEAFERRAKALAELRKAGPIQPLSTPTMQAATQHKKKKQMARGLKRRFRALRTHRRRQLRATSQKKREEAAAAAATAPQQQQNVGPLPGQLDQGGGGGGVYNVESNFAPKFKDTVAGNRQADDNDNNNNANNDNNNNDNSNNAVQVSGSGNRLRYHVKDRNININLNMNYFGNANHNAGPEKARAAAGAK